MMIQAVRENAGLEYHRVAMEGQLRLSKNENGDIQLDLSFKLEEAHLVYERTTYSTKLALPGMYERLRNVRPPALTWADAPEWKRMLEEAKKIIEEFVRMLKMLLGGEIDEKRGTARVVTRARGLIRPGGYWSPEKTAERILKFARSISGNDVSKIGLLKAAAEKAFEEVKEKLGGSLLEILRETHRLVMDGFEKWEKQAASEEMVA